MTKILVGLGTALGILVASGAMAQSLSASTVAGRWLYDSAGHTLGSVVGPADGGRSAKIMIGSYFQPGSHQALVPADALSVVDGKVVLQPQTVQALNLPTRR